jgi:hypothetical protein
MMNIQKNIKYTLTKLQVADIIAAYLIREFDYNYNININDIVFNIQYSLDYSGEIGGAFQPAELLNVSVEVNV